MFRGLFQLTWLEVKIFLREPLGALGNIAAPVLVLPAPFGPMRPKISPSITAKEMSSIATVLP